MERRQGAGSIAGLMSAFVAASTVLGLLAAGIIMPIVGAGGMGAKSVVTAFDALPAQFTASAMAQQSRILAKDGSIIATLYDENRQVVPIEDIAPVMQQAQVAIEDRRFYEHGGVDGRGLLRAFASTAGGGGKQGASTLTQQYVRQLLIATATRKGNKAAAEAAQARSGIPGIVRKIQEMKYAISMEQRRSKEQILEGYLNIVYYGAQAYGVEAASRRYFSIPAKKLNLPQAALIAGLAQNPGAADPINAPKRALERRNDVLKAMQDQGMISSRAMTQAIESPLALKTTLPKQSCPAATNPYVCDYVVKWLMEQPALGKDPKERRDRLYYGGLNVKTTFDADLTAYTTSTLAKRVSPTNANQRGAAAAVVEPGTGRVLAIGQNTEWALEGGPGKTGLNWAVDAKYGASAGFQIGSTAKMFGVVTALEQGMTANSRFYAPADGHRWPGSAFDGAKCGYNDRMFTTVNAEGDEHGMTSLKQATAKSVNTAFGELATMTGVCPQRDVMKRMGMVRADGQPYGSGGLAATILGADNASPLTLAASYATLAAGGMYCEPRPVESVEAFDGTKLPIGENKCSRAISPKIAYDTTRILQSVVTSGTGKKAAVAKHPVAGKTGTADGSRETWFAGYTPQLASAVWYGTPYDQRSVGAYGGTVAAPLFSRIMSEASKDLKTEKFRLLDEGDTGGADSGDQAEKDTPQVKVPDVMGRGRNSATRILEEAGFKVEVNEERVDGSDQPRGRVVEVSPGVGEQADEGETVTLSLSSGE